MQTLIAGGGDLGYWIASYLTERGENVSIIDEDKSRCDWLSKNVDASVYNGNILDASLLMEAGIDKADALVTALGNDEITVKLVDFAKSQFGVPKVIAITKNLSVTPHAKECGADKVICSEETVLNEIEGLLHANGHKMIYTDRSKDCKIARLNVKATSRMLGRAISEITERNARIAVLLRGDQTIFPSEDELLQMGDELFLIGREESVNKLIDRVEET